MAAVMQSAASPDLIEQDVIDVLCIIGRDYGGNNIPDATWTKQIMSELEKRAPQGHSSCGRHCGRGEFMWDLLWVKSHKPWISSRTEPLIDAILALESEWTTDGVMDDFRKLLLARVDNRVMIFQGRRKTDCADMFAKMAAEIAQFKKTCDGDRYLLAGWEMAFKERCPKGRFHFRLHVVGQSPFDTSCP